jgi:hypothetical protein
MTREILADYARAGFALVAWDPKTGKGPVWKGWNLKTSAVTDPETAGELDGNVGIAHVWSGTCAIDLDDLQQATEWLRDRGIDPDDYLTDPTAVMISSGRENRAKLLYRTSKVYPSFKLPGFELRCGTRTGTTVQDVIPPSRHPDTGRDYEWAYGSPGGHWSRLPELPEAFRLLWESLITPETKIAEREPREAADEFRALKIARKVVMLHDPDAHGYDHWLHVGMAIHHDTGGSGEGLDLFDEWSRKGAKYNGREEIEAKWRSFHTDTANPRTLASLRVEDQATADEFQVVELSADVVPGNIEDTIHEEGKRALREMSKDGGKFEARLSNVVTLLGVAEAYGHVLARDTFKDLLVIAPTGTEAWRGITDTDYTRIRQWAETTGNFWPLSREMVRDALYLVAERNSVDTAQKWLAGLKWDGVPRVEHFAASYWGTIDAPYEQSVSRYLWTALAGRVMEPGCQVDMVPILVGGQGLGKSTGVRALVPDQQFFVELRFDDSDDTLARKMRGVLVGELAELQGLKTQDINRIKAFVTRTHEKWIPKYMEFATEFPRRLVMVGTTNEDEFLSDIENRRFLPLRTTGVDVAAIKRDRDQLWAEGLVRWMEHGVEWQEAEKLGKLNTEQYTLEDNWQGVIEQWLRDSGNTRVRMNDVLIAAVGLDVRHITRVHELRGARVLRVLGWERRTATDKTTGKKAKVWERVHEPISAAVVESDNPWD